MHFYLTLPVVILALTDRQPVSFFCPLTARLPALGDSEDAQLLNFAVPEPSALSAWLACWTRLCCPRAILTLLRLPPSLPLLSSRQPLFAYAKGQDQHTASVIIAADNHANISLTNVTPRHTSLARHNSRSIAGGETAICDLLVAQTLRLRLHEGRSTTPVATEHTIFQGLEHEVWPRTANRPTLSRRTTHYGG